MIVIGLFQYIIIYEVGFPNTDDMYRITYVTFNPNQTSSLFTILYGMVATVFKLFSPFLISWDSNL
jgi:hypothetical protein